MERGCKLFGKATFVMDRGYDDNKMFLKLDKLEQDYVIRLTSKRKLFFHNKWVPATQLRNQRKGIGLTEHPMMLATNKVIKSKDDVIRIARLYFSRWRIEEAIIQTAAPIKGKVNFCYYRLAKGVAGILSYAKEGIRLWFRTKRPAYRQMCLKLVA